MKKLYYAHCMSLYDTKQEERDIKLLKELGYDVLNPNQLIHQQYCKLRGDTMSYFLELIESCEVLAFRALPSGEIPAGVYKEIQKAYENNIPVFELPVNIELREMSLRKTRGYLKEIGQR